MGGECCMLEKVLSVFCLIQSVGWLKASNVLAGVPFQGPARLPGMPGWRGPRIADVIRIPNVPALMIQGITIKSQLPTLYLTSLTSQSAIQEQNQPHQQHSSQIQPKAPQKCVKKAPAPPAVRPPSLSIPPLLSPKSPLIPNYERPSAPIVPPTYMLWAFHTDSQQTRCPGGVAASMSLA